MDLGIHTRSSGQEPTDPWTGSPKWVKVKDRDDVGTVIQAGKNLGSLNSIYCNVIYFERTGEVRFYAQNDCTRCDEQGNTTPPKNLPNPYEQD